MNRTEAMRAILDGKVVAVEDEYFDWGPWKRYDCEGVRKIYWHDDVGRWLESDWGGLPPYDEDFQTVKHPAACAKASR